MSETMEIPVTINQTCGCGSEDTMVLSCSGASDVGAVSDGIARMYSISGTRKMNCLANLASEPARLTKAWMGRDILVIDGCEKACGHELLNQTGLPHRVEFVTDYGCKKGQTLVSTDTLRTVYAALLKKDEKEKQGYDANTGTLPSGRK